MPWRMPRTMPWRRLGRDRRAATAVEFAIVGPAFLLVLLAVFDFAYQLAVDLALNYGTTAAARYASTGAVQGTAGANGSNATNNSAISTYIANSTGGFLNASLINVTATSYGSPSSYVAGTGASSGSNGSSSSIVVYTVTYPQPFLTGLPGLMAALFHSSSLSGGITHTATVVVQNEPY